MREASVYNQDVLTVARELNPLTLHHIAENCSNGTPAGACFLFQFFFIVRLRFGAHHDRFKFIIITDACNRLVWGQHPLIAQKPNGKVFGVIPNCHGRYDFLGI